MTGRILATLRRLGAIAPALLLAACTAKAILSNEQQVVVEALTTGKAVTFAEGECGRYGRSAVLTGTGLKTFVFDCRQLAGDAGAAPEPPPPPAPQPQAANPHLPPPPAMPQLAYRPQPPYPPQPAQAPLPAQPPHQAAQAMAPPQAMAPAPPPRAAPPPPVPDAGMAPTSAPAEAHPPPAPRKPPRALTGSSGGKGWWVQIAADRTREEAQSSGSRVKRKFGRLLKDRTYRITQISLRDGVTYFRSRFGPYASKAAAGRACSSMKARRQACIIAR